MSIIAIPAYIIEIPTSTQLAYIHDQVHNLWGSKSLHPTVIEMIANQLSLNQHTVAYHVFKELMMAEFSIIQRYNAYLQKQPLPDVETSPYLHAMVTNINECWATRPTTLTSSLHDLAGDLHARDVVYFLTDYMPDVKSYARINVHKLQAAPLFQTALAPMKQGNFNTVVIAVDDQYTYLGHVYMFPSKYVGCVNVMGIRGSIVNIICGRKTNVTKLLFDGVNQVALAMQYTHIVVRQPLLHIKTLLAKRGFIPFTGIDIIAPVAQHDIKVNQYGVYAIDIFRPITLTPEFSADLMTTVGRVGVDLNQLILYQLRGWLFNPKGLLKELPHPNIKV